MKFIELLAARGCGDQSVFGIPPWHQFLQGSKDAATGACNLQFGGLMDIWLVALGVLEILMRIGAYTAIVFVIWGGFSFITSQGSPERIAQARSTITNAIIGLIITIVAAQIVTFIARSIS